MYLIPSPVTVYLDGDRLRVASDWKRALELLRDSLGGRYGPLVVMGPWKPAADAEQTLADTSLQHDGIELIAAFDEHERLRRYWLGAHKQAMTKVHELMPKVKVLHGTAEEPFRAFCFAAFMAGVRAKRPTVFVQDQDVASVVRDLHKDDGWKSRLKAEAHARLQERHCTEGVRSAGVSFLKGRTTMQRYANLSAHVHQLEDTSFFSREIVAASTVEARLSSLATSARPLRFVFAGRLIDIKGVDRSLRMLRRAIDQGANVTLDVIGGGPEEVALLTLARVLKLEGRVTFHGPMTYGPALLQRMATCDALLFNPRMEETPRMIFDGYAAGLPLVAGGIDYVNERAAAEQACLVLPRDDDEAAADLLVSLDRDRSRLVPLTHAALKAASHHAADRWYERRAAWTHDMVARHQAAHART